MSCHHECHDTEAEHEAWFAKEEAYWRRHFGQDFGTPEERARVLRALDPRNMEARIAAGGCPKCGEQRRACECGYGCEDYPHKGGL